MAVEHDTGSDREHRGLQIAHDARLTAQLEAFARQDVARQLAADHDAGGTDLALKHCVLADDQGTSGDYLAAHLPVEHRGTAEVELPLQHGGLIDQDRKLPATYGRSRCAPPPHAVVLTNLALADPAHLSSPRTQPCRRILGPQGRSNASAR